MSLQAGGWYHDVGADVLYVQVQRGVPQLSCCCRVEVGGTVIHFDGPDRAAVYGVEVVGTSGWTPPDCLPSDVAAQVAAVVAGLAG